MYSWEFRMMKAASTIQSVPRARTKVALVTNLIVTYNSSDEIRACLDSIRAQSVDFEMETILVDNASKDGTADIVRAEYAEVKFIDSGYNAGFAAANNLAFQEAQGRFILLINPDSVMRPEAVAAAIKYMAGHPRCGIVGGLLVDEEGHAHPSARKFPSALTKLITLSGLAERFSSSRFFGAGDFRWFDHKSPLAVDWVPGAFTCVRRSMIEEVGFFDERFFLYYEETDLCLRAKRHGWDTFFIPDSVIEHEGGASSKKIEGQTFDQAGSQVRRFRMMAECLYHRKNYGLASLLANVGVEILWHQMRRLVNMRPGVTAKNKRKHSAELVKGLWSALHATSYGRISPATPW